MSIKNVDTLLHNVIEEKLDDLAGIPAKEKYPESEPEEIPLAAERKSEYEEKKASELPQDPSSTETQAENSKSEKDPKSEASTSVDEYGNELPPAKTYTEEEVQRMIRDRVARMKAPQVQQEQRAEAAKDFVADPNSSDEWEVQLEKFVENTIQKREHKQQTLAMQQREHKIQSEFETKFTSGMERYKDFRDVVADKPITDSMMLATRGMNDPAAFIYAAAKQHPKELDRIAQIQDPYQQGAEIGKLEERMKKARGVSAATKPITKSVGDAAEKSEVKRSIDSLIIKDANRRLRRR